MGGGKGKEGYRGKMANMVVKEVKQSMEAAKEPTVISYPRWC